MDVPLSRFDTATLAVAFAASVAVHVSTFAALVGVDGGPPRATAAQAVPAPAPVLEARLVAAVPTTAPLPVIPAPASGVFAPPSSPPEAAPPERNIAKASSGAATGERSPVGWKPRIVINDRVPRARFGEALDGDTLAAFPVEIDAAVVLPKRIEVPYPREALAARKEGAVLVWATIDAQGAVESVHIVEGEPEFAAAVEAALPRTRFIPAHDLGVNIPYYITLEFEFRLDATGGKVAAERAGASPR